MSVPQDEDAAAYGSAQHVGHGAGDGSGLYRPPRNMATSMEDDPDRYANI